MRGLPIVLSLFCTEFDISNYAGERMLAPIYHWTLKLFKTVSKIV